MFLSMMLWYIIKGIDSAQKSPGHQNFGHLGDLDFESLYSEPF